MRLASVFRKSLREQLRAPWMLALTISIAPVFVLMYWLFYGGGSTTYTVLVVNADQGAQRADGTPWQAGAEAVQALRAVTYADGRALLKIRPATDRPEAEQQLRDRQAVALLVLPADFSQALLERRPAAVTLVGDLTNPPYAVAAVLAASAVDAYAQTATGQTGPLRLSEEPLGASGTRTEFELYVPGLLVVAVAMLVFQAAMTVAREVEAGTFSRLQLTPLSAFEYLGGITLAQMLVALAAVALTFLTALALGFRSQGPLWVAVLVTAMASLSVIGISLIVACFTHTVGEAFVVANFPLMFLMFFSGAVFPMPPIPLATVGGRTLGLFDFIPQTHAVAALNKVMTLGAGLGGVAYELGALGLLSGLYFAAGVWLFQRTHLRRR